MAEGVAIVVAVLALTSSSYHGRALRQSDRWRVKGCELVTKQYQQKLKFIAVAMLKLCEGFVAVHTSCLLSVASTAACASARACRNARALLCAPARSRYASWAGRPPLSHLRYRK